MKNSVRKTLFVAFSAAAVGGFAYGGIDAIHTFNEIKQIPASSRSFSSDAYFDSCSASGETSSNCVVKMEAESTKAVADLLKESALDSQLGADAIITMAGTLCLGTAIKLGFSDKKKPAPAPAA